MKAILVPQNRIEFAKSALESLAHITVILGLGLAVWGFFSERKIRKELYTVEYSREYNSERIMDARIEIRKSIKEIIRSLKKYNNNARTVSILLSSIVKKNKNYKLKKSLIIVSEYYNVAKSCVDGNLCDKIMFVTLTQDEASKSILLCYAGSRIY